MTHLFTRDLYDRLPEGFPAELLDGLLVREPAPTRGHQTLVGALHLSLVPLVGLRRVLVAPVDVGLDDMNVLQPDLVVYATPPPLDAREIDVPSVVFEVLSPSTRRLDRGLKAAKYLEGGVREVWLVDPDRETVEIRTADEPHRRIHRGEEEARSTAVEGYALVPSALFGILRD